MERSDGTGLVYRGSLTYRKAADGTLTLEGADVPEGRLTPNGVRMHVTAHLGSVRAVVDGATGNLYTAKDYDAYGTSTTNATGSSYLATAPTGETFRQGFTGQEDQGPDFSLPYTDYGARQYSPALRRWLVLDPMSEKYYGISPYAYCAGSPVNLVDQMGLSPIYNTEGRFLGTDDEGLQGQPIIIANDSFIQGLSHIDAMKLDLGYKGLSSIEAIFRLLANYTNLPNRPDYDGYVSVMEGIQWAKNHPNALKNPTAENTLYIDTSKLDFGLLSTTEFQKENTVTPINLFTVNNSMAALYGYRIGYGKVFDTIYALGRVNIILLNRNERTVQIVNDDATKYDWNPGGGSIRNLFILGNNALFHINPEIHGFNTYYYGKGKLHF